MGTESINSMFRILSVEERSYVRQVVQEASERIVSFSPSKPMVSQDIIHGYKHSAFDSVVRIGKHWLSGNGYLTNEEYRRRFRDGRITAESLTRALQRVGPRQQQTPSIQIESRQITALDVWRLHIMVGFKALEPSLLERELGDHGSIKQFHRDLSEDSQQRIIDRTIQECELCREYPEKAYLANLWKTTLSILQLNELQGIPQPIDHSVALAASTVSLLPQRTMSEWIDGLAGVGLVGHTNEQLSKWGIAFLDQEAVGGEIPRRRDSFYQTWRQLVQGDCSGSLFGIKGFSQRVNDLPVEPEDTIASSLEHLGILQARWREYLARQLSLSLGWLQYLRRLGEHPDYHVESLHPIDTTQYLAVRLFFEVELTQMMCQQTWGIDGTVSALSAYWRDRRKEYGALIDEGSNSVDERKQQICRDAWRFFHLAQFLEFSPIDLLDLSCDEAQALLHWLDDFPLEQHRYVWFEANEESF